jgi:integrase/recombinase XerD
MMTERQHAVSGPLAYYANGFRQVLASLGYDKRRASKHLGLLVDLSGWLEDEGLAPAELIGPEVTQFLEVRRARGHRDLVTLRGLALLLDHLRRLGVVPAASRSIPDGPAAEVLQQYCDYLSSERGLAERGVVRYLAEVGPFVRQLTGPGGLDWAALSAADVTRFVIDVCSDSQKKPSSSLLAALRSFLRFAQLEGWIDLPLTQAVPSVAGWSGAALPRRLEPDQVRRLLSGCDRHSGAGRRDYAILTLLVRLGLRAGEVARLQLGDIDWRAGELLVCGKGQREEMLPLPDDVGKAVVDYLRHGRPRTTSRAVFLRLHVPLQGLTPIGVSSLVYRACDRAGVTRVSAHPLRHTAATEMLRAGASLAEVGQALRQRSPSSTAIYAKVDHVSLRALARPWPGGVA